MENEAQIKLTNEAMYKIKGSGLVILVGILDSGKTTKENPGADILALLEI